MMIHRNMCIDRVETSIFDTLRKTTAIIAVIVERRKSIFDAEALRLRCAGATMEVSANIVDKANELSDEEQEALDNFRRAKMRLIAVMMCKADICSIVEALQKYRSKISVDKKMNVSSHVAAQEDAISVAAESSFDYHFR